MSNDIVPTLKKKKLKILNEIEKLERQIAVIDDLINEEAGERKVTRKSSDKIFYKKKVKKILRVEKAQTYKLYQLVCIQEHASSAHLKYGTFRSYLSQMKSDNEISQDKKRYWHLKIDVPRGSL